MKFFRIQLRADGGKLLMGGLLTLLILTGPAFWRDRSCNAFAAEIVATEEAVKATYLVKFCLFTEWPPGRFSKPDSPFIIGVVGRADIATELEKIAATRTIEGRQLVIHRLNPGGDFSDCHMVFIGRDNDFASILPKLKTRGVLIVGEHDRFTQRGGMVNFVPVKESVKYDVNKDAALNAGLTIRSQMLGFARALVTSDPAKNER